MALLHVLGSLDSRGDRILLSQAGAIGVAHGGGVGPAGGLGPAHGLVEVDGEGLAARSVGGQDQRVGVGLWVGRRDSQVLGVRAMYVGMGVKMDCWFWKFMLRVERLCVLVRLCLMERFMRVVLSMLHVGKILACCMCKDSHAGKILACMLHVGKILACCCFSLRTHAYSNTEYYHTL